MTKPTRRDQLGEWMGSNSGLTATLMLFLFVLARVSAAAELNPSLALTLKRESDPVDNILGTLMSGFPLFVFGLLFLSWYWFIKTFSFSSQVASGVASLAGGDVPLC